MYSWVGGDDGVDGELDTPGGDLIEASLLRKRGRRQGRGRIHLEVVVGGRWDGEGFVTRVVRDGKGGKA